MCCNAVPPSVVFPPISQAHPCRREPPPAGVMRVTENSHMLINVKQQRRYQSCLFYMQKFKPVITDQLFLLPPSIEDFVPAGHLARVVNDIVDTIDVSAIEKKYSMLGQKSYHPHLMLKLLFYG